jgi:hypothetical protein
LNISKGGRTKSIALFSNKKEYALAAKDLIEQARSRVDYKPDLALFYATLKYNSKYQEMLNILHDEYGDIPQIGASVDGMIFPDDMRTDGAALVLCRDEDARICVDGIKEKGSIKSAEKLAGKVNCKNGAIVLHFPLVHVPGALKSAEFYARGFYYSKRCKGANQKKQKEYAEKFSNYCDKENIFYLPPSILDIFAKQTNYKVPIIGLNIMHTQVRLNSPSIFCNFKDIGGGVAALTIEKKGVNAVFDDIFPEKGVTLEDSKKKLRKEFTVLKEFKANFNKNVLISLDGMPPIEAVKNLTALSQKNREDLLNQIGKGDFQAQTPYMLMLSAKKPKGIVLIGIGSYYPFDLYPFFVDISDYSEDVLLGYEFVDFKSHDFISSLKSLEQNNSFKFFCLDVGSIAAFGRNIFSYKDEIQKLVRENYFGILTEAPSIYLPKEMRKRNYISEAEPDIFFTSAGTNICLEI